MATTTNQEQARPDVKAGGGTGEIGSPISNEAYNVINALANKLEGLEAFRKYSKDGRTDVWQKLSDLDRQCVNLLCDQLESLVRDGRLRSASGEKRTVQ